MQALKKIYISLLDEGTEVIRPTYGEALGNDIFRVLPTNDYDPEIESWQFLPYSLVECISQIREEEEIFLADSLVQDAP